MKTDLPATSTRREWIRSAGAVTLALATPGWLVAGPVTTPAVTPPATAGLDALDYSMARSLLGQQFEMVSTAGHAICELANVEVVPNRRSPDKTQSSFSMDFRPIDSQGSLLQDTYLVQHATLGTFDLFVVPHTNTRGVKMLVATFSRR